MFIFCTLVVDQLSIRLISFEGDWGETKAPDPEAQEGKFLLILSRL